MIYFLICWGGMRIRSPFTLTTLLVIPVPSSSSSSSSSNGPTTTPLTTRGFCPGVFVVWASPKFVQPHWTDGNSVLRSTKSSTSHDKAKQHLFFVKKKGEERKPPKERHPRFSHLVGVEFFYSKLIVCIPGTRGLLYSHWQPLGISSTITLLGQLHQSPPSPIPGDLGRGPSHQSTCSNIETRMDRPMSVVRVIRGAASTVHVIRLFVWSSSGMYWIRYLRVFDYVSVFSVGKTNVL